MPANHQTLNLGQLIPTNNVLQTATSRIRVPSSLIFRRLYLGAFWANAGEGRFFTMRIEFLLGGKSDGGELNFGWRSNGYGNLFGFPTGMAYSRSPEFPICPPFSVENVPAGSATDFVSAAPAQADEMIASDLSGDVTGIRNVRMLPIPIVVKCDEMRCYLQCYWNDGTGITSPSAGFNWYLGCRSSDYAL